MTGQVSPVFLRSCEKRHDDVVRVPFLPVRTSLPSCPHYNGSLYSAPVDQGLVRYDGNGNYVRDTDGRWYYERGRDPVPGGHDLLLGDVYPAPERGTGRRAVRRVPRRWLRRRSGHPLAWVLELVENQPRVDAGGEVDDAVEVSTSVWLRHAGDVVGMVAPELHPSALLGVADVAELIGVSPATVRAYLHRRQMPPPVTRVGDTPMWSRPIIERWRWP